MKKLLGILTVLTLVLTSSSFGFDGQRKGFVLGGGLGFSPAANWSVDVPTFLGTLNVGETNVGVSLNLVIGYAWDEQNMIVYEGNVAGVSSDFFNQTLSQGFNGAAWYHYYGLPGSSAFTTAGLGFYVFDGENFTANDPGVGILLGAGYEFARHWQVGGYFSFGKTSDVGINFDHYHFSILLSGVAF